MVGWLCALVLAAAAYEAQPRSAATVGHSLLSSGRVSNGVDDAGKYPYVVALLFMNMRMCSGTLLAPTWVLTAAHCKMVNSIQYGNMTVTPRHIQSASKLLKLISHQRFAMIQTPDVINNDIAMILVEEIPLKVFGKLSAVDYKAISGLQVEYAGYGKTGKKNGLSGVLEDLMRPLQLADGVVVSCKAMYDMVSPCMCVAPRCASRQSVLPGDSGGPLFHDGKIIGVAHKLLKEQVISVFMPVSPFLTWIQQVMMGEQNLNLNRI